MNPKYNHYRVTLEHTFSPKDEPLHKNVTIDFDNHDDIFDIIERLQQRDLFTGKEESAEFAIGLKMFSEVMLRHRGHPLFEELAPAFGDFMKKLKGKR